MMHMIRHQSIADQAAQINQYLLGQYVYYSIGDNIRSLFKIYRIAERHWYKMLCSRSRESYILWENFQQVTGVSTATDIKG